MVEQVQATASVRPAQHFNQLSHQAHEVRPLHQPDPRIRNTLSSLLQDHRRQQGRLQLSFAVNSSATQLGPDFAFNSFSKCALAPPLESVHQTQVFSVLLAFLSLVMAWADRFGRRGDQRVKAGRSFCSLIVQQMRWSLAERFKCKVYDLTAKLFCISLCSPRSTILGR